MAIRTATRYHDFSAGHRVAGHENKCAKLHGHNYRIHFTLAGDLDNVGRVLDFSEIGRRLCNWLETHWDHRFLVWERDELIQVMLNNGMPGITITTFNPTAENMAEYLVKSIGPLQLYGTGAQLVECVVEETRKCSASYKLEKAYYDGLPSRYELTDVKGKNE